MMGFHYRGLLAVEKIIGKCLREVLVELIQEINIASSYYFSGIIAASTNSWLVFKNVRKNIKKKELIHVQEIIVLENLTMM